MELLKVMVERWAQEKDTSDVDNNPFNPDDDPWYDEDDEKDPFDPTGESPVDLYGPWWE
jgi:hypothetical protein